MGIKKWTSIIILLEMMLFLSLQSYVNGSTEYWEVKSSMPTARWSFNTVSCNGKIYAIGGSNTSASLSLNIVEEYNPMTDTWTVKSPMPTARCLYATAVLNEKIYVIGGYTAGDPMHPNNYYTNVVEVYDPATDSWITKKAMPTPRQGLSASVLDGKIYAVGGYNNGGLNNVEVYDPNTDTWSIRNSFPISGMSTKIATINNKLYSFGMDVREYDTNSDTWILKNSMPIPKTWFGLAVFNNNAYIVGGQIPNGDMTKGVEIYDSTLNSWTAAASLPENRTFLGTAIANGKLFAFGGCISFDKVVELTIAQIPANPSTLSAVAGNSKVDLFWSATSGSAITYNIKRSTTSGGIYATIATTSAITYTDNSVINDTTYYYVVSAVSSSAESANSNEVSATPTSPAEPPVVGGNKAILEIVMADGIEKEYDLTAAELHSFLTWYDGRSDGTGKAYYTFIKKNNIKPFLSRKEYIAFDKIQSFEVKDYNE